MTGIAGCCARATNGQVAAAPNSVMNSRRLMSLTQAQDDTVAYRMDLLCITAKSGARLPTWVINAFPNIQACPVYPISGPMH